MILGIFIGIIIGANIGLFVFSIIRSENKGK